uniref:Uncharacterized protein n=1 Tax=Caenorhabditis japonica TaxID=281687 RepID=A0A8R1IDF3_CAEJA
MSKFSVKNENEPIELTVTSSEQPNAVTSSGGAHVNETSIDTSSTDTGISRMESGQKVPVLAVGTYHRKEAAPILAAAARLDLPSTSTMSKSAGKEKNSNKD